MADDAPVTVQVASDADIVRARQIGRQMASALGFSDTDLTLVATAISELARNITLYAGSGEIVLRVIADSRREGIEVVARDRGPGIEDIERAMQDGFTTGEGMGLGLPGARRLMDELTLVAPLGVGTTVTVRKWKYRRAV